MITDEDNLTVPRASSAGGVSKLAKASRFAGILAFMGLVAAAPPFVLKILRFKIASKDVELKGRRVAVFSPGADQKEGTHDDIRTW